MARDYSAEYERRNELAQEQGWDSYGEKRHDLERFDAREDLQERWDKAMDEFGLTDNYQDFHAFMDIFGGTGEFNDSTAVGDPLYEWYVEITGEFTPEEWAEKYGEA
jgi:hypothetical protein